MDGSILGGGLEPEPSVFSDFVSSLKGQQENLNIVH